MLEKAAKGIQIHDTVITIPFPLHPTSVAIGLENIQIPAQITSDVIRFAQNATAVDLNLSSSSLNSC